MKSNIFPIEDKEKYGCCISYKIYDNIVKKMELYVRSIIK